MKDLLARAFPSFFPMLTADRDYAARMLRLVFVSGQIR